METIALWLGIIGSLLGIYSFIKAIENKQEKFRKLLKIFGYIVLVLIILSITLFLIILEKPVLLFVFWICIAALITIFLLIKRYKKNFKEAKNVKKSKKPGILPVKKSKTCYK